MPDLPGAGHSARGQPGGLVPNGRLSLRQGAVAVWPDFTAVPTFARTIQAFAKDEGIDLDTPFDDLDGRSKRIILHGAGETWYTIDGGTSLQPVSANRMAKASS